MAMKSLAPTDCPRRLHLVQKLVQSLVTLVAIAPLASGASVRGHLQRDLSHPEELASDNENATFESSEIDDRYGLNLVRGVPKIKIKRAGSMRGSKNASYGLEKHDVLVVSCFEPFPGPKKKIRCPEACPYMRFDPDRMCYFKCITRDWCLNAPNMPSSFPDDEVGQCITCQVPGCAKCVSPTQCFSGECKPGFDSVNGACLPQSRTMWRTIIITVAVFVLIAAVYLGSLWSRKIRQPILMKLAMAFRSLSKIRQDDAPHHLYPLTGTNMCKQLISGVGVLLHFRFQAFWLIWSSVVLFVALVLAIYFGRFKETDIIASTPTHEEVFRSCARFGSDEALQVVAVQQTFTWFTFATYACTTIACILFAIWQQRSYYDEEAKHTTMEDFGLCVYHMPIEKARDDIEEDYTNFFKKEFGEEQVIGVSICWDYRDQEDAIVTQVTSELHAYDAPFDATFLTKDEHEDLRTPRAESADKDAQRSCIPELRCLDNALVGSTTEPHEMLTPKSATDIVKAIVAELSTTGTIFVVFNSEKDQKAALAEVKRRAADGSPIQYPGAEKPIGITREEWDPATLLWTGFSVRRPQRHWNIFVGICVVLMVIVVWATVFYGPYVVYVLSWSKVAGSSQGDDKTMMLLGLMCAIGNQVVYFTCAKVADKIGFRSKDFAMTFNCCMYTLAVFLNIVVDVSLMLVMAHGYQQDSGMNPKATIRNPSFQYSLYIQLVTYLYPMTLLAPYLAEPAPMNIIPYFLAKWMVRSAYNISRYDAELSLACPEFDLLRYGDIIINVSTVIICFFLASSSLWWIFMWLFVSNAVIYLWDHFRILRACQETMFANDLMECCSQLISSLPCALLAAAYVFKTYEGEQLIQSWDVRHKHQDVVKDIEDDLSSEWKQANIQDFDSSVWAAVFCAFFMHIVIHCFVVAFLVPKLLPTDEQVSTIPYREYSAGCACNWFNSNPVHVLRSRFVHDHDPPFIFFMQGKEYVHKRNHKIHQYYEETSVEEVQEGVQEEFTQTITSKAGAAMQKVHSGIAHIKLPLGKKRLGSADQNMDHQDDSVEGGCQIL